MKLVKESLDEFYGDGYTSSVSSDVNPTMSETREKTRPDDPSWISPEEAERALLDIVESSETKQELTMRIQEFFEKNPYMHAELGEAKGRDYYKDAFDAFIKVYYEKFPD